MNVRHLYFFVLSFGVAKFIKKLWLIRKGISHYSQYKKNYQNTNNYLGNFLKNLMLSEPYPKVRF